MPKDTNRAILGQLVEEEVELGDHIEAGLPGISSSLPTPRSPCAEDEDSIPTLLLVAGVEEVRLQAMKFTLPNKLQLLLLLRHPALNQSQSQRKGLLRAQVRLKKQRVLSRYTLPMAGFVDDFEEGRLGTKGEEDLLEERFVEEIRPG
jgi:hypothetical protein